MSDQKFEHRFTDGVGGDAELRVMGMVEQSGLPLEFWEKFPEWKHPPFANYFLGVYLRMKSWGAEYENNK